MKDHDYYRSEKEAKYPGPGRSLFGESAPPDQPAGMAEVRKKKGLINEDSVPPRTSFAGSLRSMSFRRLFFVPVPVSTLGRARVGSFGYWRKSLTGPLTG